MPEYDGRILLCRRAIEPRHGYWTIPAGFMENDETTQEGARRESMEEALADVEIGSLLAVVHVLHADQVHVMFRARLPEPRFGVGAESLEVMLVSEAEIPWQDIAFRSVDFALRKYFDDRRRGVEDHHFTALDLPQSAGQVGSALHRINRLAEYAPLLRRCTDPNVACDPETSSGEAR